MNCPVPNPVIGIVGGRGALGSRFRAAFASAGYQVLVSGRRPDGQTVLSTAELVKKSAVVIVTVFLKDSRKLLSEIAPLLRADQLFCDFTSLKEQEVKIMLKSKAAVIGLHPMFGAVSSLAGHSIFACPARPRAWWPWLLHTLQSFGLSVHRTTAREHDQLAAIHQNAPHLLSLALAGLLRRQRIQPAELLAKASPSTQLELLVTGRLLANDPELYRDIQLLNPAAPKVARQLATVLETLARSVEQRDGAGLLKEIKASARHFGEFKELAMQQTNQIFAARNKTPNESASLNFPELAPRLATAIFGPASQTELAAHELSTRTQIGFDPVYLPTIPEIFAAVTKGRVKLGVVPLENYQVGPVRGTVKELFAAQGKVRIVSELSRPIEHSLVGQSQLQANAVTRIFAHPQARAQCQKFLQKHFPAIEIVETPHTGESIRLASLDSTTLAIGPAEFAATFGLQVLKKGIEDDPNNRTRFILIARSQTRLPPLPQPTKTALAFYFRSNRAGQLAAALTIFARHQINLSRLESIPTEHKLGDFFFFTECEATEPELTTALHELRQLAKVVLLGSFGEAKKLFKIFRRIQ